ncbi:MAG: hypothetical protein WCV90_08140 [Candidatus Woesearchaeota archaeon]|jgi:hypothetical protein
MKTYKLLGLVGLLAYCGNCRSSNDIPTTPTTQRWVEVDGNLETPEREYCIGPEQLRYVVDFEKSKILNMGACPNGIVERKDISYNLLPELVREAYQEAHKK